jgi:hypothetical protein
MYCGAQELCYFCISHFLTVFPITVPSDTWVVFAISTTAFKKRVAYPLTLLIRRYQQFVLVLNWHWKIPTQKKLFLNFDLSYMSCMNKKRWYFWPIILNNKTAHTTGLYFNTNFSKLYYTRLKLVFSTQHSIIGLELMLYFPSCLMII